MSALGKIASTVPGLVGIFLHVNYRERAINCFQLQFATEELAKKARYIATWPEIAGVAKEVWQEHFITYEPISSKFKDYVIILKGILRHLEMKGEGKPQEIPVTGCPV